MAVLSGESRATLVSGFYRASMTFMLATFGGEVVLLQTVFLNGSHRWLVYLSVSFLVLGCLSVLAAHEALMLRTCYPERFKARLARLLLKCTPTSSTSEVYFRATAGFCHGTGLVLFAAFVWFA